ncbi:oxygen-independent coproporphyrinogen III oxidase [Algoriphagus hitonicola]|uniref:Coproporphyrinogen-III oxidase n=1 Tax=Algoriphagus hitonicola TaxID=435880 RepID=A0A1I2SY89_9BACT|nr:oxygen-independent coproporphyrinogen III oxidase [Algoriphagus hitonicola]SFG54921.1 oxygen-independent coproporphyrinogen-3 oxidase [Algoriphagus hitonicola]
MNLPASLIQKYNKPTPRYTSYPTVPLWENNLNAENWGELVKKSFHQYGKSEGITLYLHLPFCESLCTYCGCNKRITKNHQVESPYLEALLTEWKKYLALFDEKPKLAGIHLGGGTPTFFSPESLHYLLSNILKDVEILQSKEFSFEGHPNNTTLEHLEVLANLGFDRVSYGIQDFDQTVQKAIHRIQPVEKVEEATLNARKTGYNSVNFDLIYGLPHQTLKTLEATFEQVARLAPDRIAFYSYAHVPSSFPAQRSYESFLPSEQQKRALYEYGKEKLIQMGYEEIGMDHFAKPEDPLSVAKAKGTLHRNFMGYTTSPSRILIGLGASSISDIYLAYCQNEKSISAYENNLLDRNWPLQKGHILSEEDLEIKALILGLICTGKAEIPTEILDQLPIENLKNLQEMQSEDLLEINGKSIQVSEMGMALIRTICMQFDLRLIHKSQGQLTFSKVI